VNNVRPAQLQMRVLDGAGHVLKTDSVRYRWISGAPITVSPSGAVTCTRRGNAVVRASLGTIGTVVTVRCHPVQEIRASAWIDFVAGDSARHLPFVAIGVDGSPVTELRGAASVIDSSVATLLGPSIRPRAVGATSVDVKVGDRMARMEVVVHERVRSFEGLRADQQYVAVPILLAQGDTVRHSLPRGVFWLKYMPQHAGEAPPTITVDGAIACTPGDGIRVYSVPLDEFGTYCRVRSDPGGAAVTLAHGRTGPLSLRGSLAIERVEFR
jgi:hypothetical protein